MNADNECLDVREIGVEIAPGLYELKRFTDDADYRDSQTDKWIWSIGERNSDGKIFAATDSRFYLNDDYKCLWLR